MDPNKKGVKKAPPVPKFVNSSQSQPKDLQLQKKLNSFLTQIQKQSKSNIKQEQTQNQIQQKKPQSVFLSKEQIKQASNQPHQNKNKNQAPQDKKKFTLAGINSKLNDMLNSKKLNLNRPAEQKPKIQQSSIPNLQKKKRNQLQVEYDPNQPNSYDLAKHFYIQKLQQMNHSSQEQEEQDKDMKANKIGYNHGLKLREMIDESEEMINNEDQINEEELQQKQEVALRMMQKLGYKVGEGLGKQSQGIKTPLTIKKTTDSSCTIQQSSISLNQMIRPQTSAKNALLANNVSITQVVVFINLVSFSELNDQVQTDLKAECQNYGKILNYIAYMMKNEESQQQLRIFIQFGNKQQAFNLFVKLNNKFYNQKLASIRFYPKDNFQKMQLNLKVHQHIQT